MAGTSDDTAAVSYAALDMAKDRLNDLAAKFLIGWREAFAVCSESAGLIAANTHNCELDLKRVDVDQQVTLTI
jgi:hypothetical protein